MAYSVAIWDWTPDTWSKEEGESKAIDLLMRDKHDKIKSLAEESNELIDVTDNILDIDKITPTEFEDYGFNKCTPLFETQNIRLREMTPLQDYKIYTGETTEDKQEFKSIHQDAMTLKVENEDGVVEDKIGNYYKTELSVVIGENDVESIEKIEIT